MTWTSPPSWCVVKCEAARWLVRREVKHPSSTAKACYPNGSLDLRWAANPQGRRPSRLNAPRGNAQRGCLRTAACNPPSRVHPASIPRTSADVSCRFVSHRASDLRFRESGASSQHKPLRLCITEKREVTGSTPVPTTAKAQLRRGAGSLRHCRTGPSCQIRARTCQRLGRADGSPGRRRRLGLLTPTPRHQRAD